MKAIFSKYKKLIIVLFSFFMIMLAICVWQEIYLKKAHSTFENYYAFRGCRQLLEKNNNYGICRTNSGQTIKIVKYQGKWFLDGDLPQGFPWL